MLRLYNSYNDYNPRLIKCIFQFSTKYIRNYNRFYNLMTMHPILKIDERISFLTISVEIPSSGLKIGDRVWADVDNNKKSSSE